MVSIPPLANGLRSGEAAQGVHEHWPLFLAQGIILSILGMAAVLVPPLAGLVTTFFVGVMLLAGGVVGLISAFWRRRATGFWWSLLSSIAAIVAGGIIIFNPHIGLVSLTALMIAYFIVNGALTIILSLQHRNKASGNWGWLLAHGILNLVIAGLLIAGLPGSIIWALGLVVGIDLLFGGGALIALAIAGREPDPAPATR